MLIIDRQKSTLLVIDIQTRLMPAIDQGETVVANARRLLDAAALVDLPVLFTEQNAKGLGPTVPEIAVEPSKLVHKMAFDACDAAGFLDRLPPDQALVVCGCESHICVLQTVLGLLDHGRKVFVVRDAVGSRRAESKETALKRMDRRRAGT